MKKIFLLILCFCSVWVYAQNPSSSSSPQAQKLFEDSNRFLNSKDYERAIALLRAAIKADSKFVAAHLLLADIYLHNQNFREAAVYFQKTIDLDPTFNKKAYYGSGISEICQGNYSASLANLKKYLSFDGITDENKKQVEKIIKDCEFALKAIKSPVPFKAQNLGAGVNSVEMEYLPVVTADERTLIFTRRVDNNEDFFSSTKKDGLWSPAKYLSTNINTRLNEGAQCISPDGNYLFFTGCNRPDGAGKCDIYVSRREGADWSTPFNLGAPVNTGAWESQPAITANGRTLYFVSSRPGGYGGYDIWKTELLEGGEWGKPENLGPNVNTPSDEISPFIHADNKTLYFSSNGWPGMGNRDLFVSRKDASGNWSIPQNLGYPINTFREESSLAVSTDGKTAFYASDVNGGFGKLDLYSFDLPSASKPEAVTYVEGLIFDKKSQQLLQADVKITELKSREVAFEDQSNEEGRFLSTMPMGRTYALSVEKEGYLLYSEHVALNKAASAASPFQIKIPLEKIEVGALFTLNNIFFETNKVDLLPESQTELNELVHFLIANPKISLEITGHTDNVGEVNANQVLSEDRARRVYGYLVNKQIPSGRLTFKGLGESKPVADNSTEEGRQKNRRTEFRILSY